MNCRYCDENLDKGDIYEVLKSDPLNADRTDAEILKFAKAYGWTPTNKERFLSVVTVQFDDRKKDQIDICPHCKGIDPLNEKAPREYFKSTHSSSSK